MSQWAYVFLQDRCTGCGACAMACKAWNHDRRGDAAIYQLDRVGSVDPSLADPDDARGTMREDWRRVNTKEEGTCPTDAKITHLSFSCMHCTKPRCMAVCPRGRIIKDEEYGVVRVNERRDCISCGLCRRACPWDAPQYYKLGSQRTSMTKCDFCYDRIRQGLKPACVAACPTRALIAGPEDELLKEFPHAVRNVEGLEEGLRTGPHFWVVPRK